MTAPKKWTIQIIDADRFNCSICGREVDTRGGYAIHQGQMKICPACARRYPKGKQLAPLITTWESWNPPVIDQDDLMTPLDLDFPDLIIEDLGNMDELF